MSAPHNDLVLFHYTNSPYGRRVVWYLTLYGINYAECIQPPILPRPDLSALGISYRRIPLLAHGRDVYCDSRLILQHLSTLFSSSASDQSENAHTTLLSILFSKWTTDGGLFPRAAQTIPPEYLTDDKFVKDREGFMNVSFTKEDQTKARPEALVNIREAFRILEIQLLGDGREWVGGGKEPGLLDIEAIWIPHWIINMPGALPQDLFSSTHFPKLYAYVQRFDQAIADAKAKNPKPISLQGADAIKHILGAGFEKEIGFDEKDPLGLKKGQEVEVWPIDSGFSHRDRGRIVGVDQRELVVEVQSKEGGEVRLHFPRVGFRVKVIQGANL